MHDIDLLELKAQLARKAMHQWQLANHLQVNPSTLSGWLTGQNSAPASLRIQIEAYLGMERGALKKKALGSERTA